MPAHSKRSVFGAIGMTDGLEANLALVRERIAVTALTSGRSPTDITIMGATKAVPPGVIIEATKLGIVDFGENWVQEAADKVSFVRDVLLSTQIRASWHMIGHLQRNKVKEALALFDSIDTIDSLRLAEELSKRARAAGRTLQVLIEIDFTDEPERNGFRLGPERDRMRSDAFLHDMEALVPMPHLRIEGLMTVAPATSDPEGARPAFQRLYELRDRLQALFPNADWRHLSMGMSQDYPVAVEEGATIVRLGTALFGARPRKIGV